MKTYLLLFVTLFFFSTYYASILDKLKHGLQIVNKHNVNNVINKFRSKKVFFVLFFNDNNNNIKSVIMQYNEIAKKLKGIMTFCIVDCGSDSSLCENELSHYVPNYKSSNEHHLLVYPITPVPKFVYTEELTVSNVKKYTYLIPNKVHLITEEKDFNIFASNFENIPKVLVFGNKKKQNYVVNALSNSFDKKLMFCYIAKELTTLVSRYNVKKFPSILLLKKDKIVDGYKGEYNYTQIFDWLNVHSETFVLGGGFDVSPDQTPEKPWKFELIPKFTKLSHGDICFKKKDKGLCLIYIKEGDKLEKNETAMLLSIKEKYKPHMNGRGINFRFMWIDISVEVNFREMFGINKFPSVVVFNPHKKIRYTKLNEDKIASQENIESLLEKISGGDSKFIVVKDQKLPEFVLTDSTNKMDEL